MAGFDPDAYLAKKPSAAPSAFDPDAYLAAVAAPSSGIPTGRGGVSQIPTEPGANLAPTVAPVSMRDRIMGVIETPAALAGGLAGGMVAPVAAMYGQLSSPAPQGCACLVRLAAYVDSQ